MNKLSHANCVRWKIIVERDGEENEGKIERKVYFYEKIAREKKKSVGFNKLANEYSLGANVRLWWPFHSFKSF